MSHAETSIKTYTIVFGLLILLLIAAVLVAKLPLGAWSLPLALGISVVKAVLIALYFMHLVHGEPLTRLFAVGALLWLGFLLVLAMADYRTRGWNSPATESYLAAPLDRLEVEDAPAVREPLSDP